MRRLEGIPTPPAPRSAVPGDPLRRGARQWRPPPKQDTEFKPYQLKPKRDGETFIEPPIEEQSNTSIDPKEAQMNEEKVG